MSPLSQSDVARLLTARAAHLHGSATVSDDTDPSWLTAQQAQVAEDIVRGLTQNIEARVRANLSRSLRHFSQLPYDLAQRLARDIEYGTLPRTAWATTLTPKDRIDIVRSASPVRQVSVAACGDSALCAADERITIASISAGSTLMPYPTGQNRESGLGSGEHRLADDEEVGARLARPENVPIAITEHLVAVAADHFETYLVTHHALPPTIANDIAVQTREVTTINLSNSCHGDELEQLAHGMQRSGRLTPFLVLRALCMGDMAFFVVVLASMANVPVRNAMRLVRDAGPTGLRSLFEKSGLPARLFPAIRVAVDVAKDLGLDAAERDPERYRVRVVTRVLAEFEQFGERERLYLGNQLIAVLTFVSAQTSDPSPARA